MARSTRDRLSIDPDKSDLVKLWLLRILVPLRGHVEFISTTGIESERLAETIGLQTPPDISFDPPEINKARVRLRKLYLAGEKKYQKAVGPIALTENIRRLASLVGLSEIDCRILEFVVTLHNDRLLDDTADWLGHLSTTQVCQTLATILALSEADIRLALASKGVLAQSGLVILDRTGSGRLRSKLDLLYGFAESMLIPEEDPLSFLKDMVVPALAPNLKWADYEHVGQSLNLMHAYLRHAVETKRKGVNIYLYGDPGTGKSQLARLLAQTLSCEMFEIASEDVDGDPVDGRRRLRAFRAAQSFFAERQALILFDEVEDVFGDDEGMFGRPSTAQRHKAWINHTLEQNPVPSLWLSNSVDSLDNAFIRRFDMVIELKVPTRKQRERIIQEACGDMLTITGVSRIAEVETLAPAVITRAAAVVGCIRGNLPGDQASAAIEYLIGSTLEAQGHAPLRKNEATRLPDYYDVSFINAGTNLEEVAAGLAKAKEGRLCLYGPPGTGKTGFGRWLADKLAVPLHVRRASDLLSKYVGGTERNIARAFKEATDRGALLLLDEVDSFLQDRTGAQRSWEVTEVNEMLAQMESYAGILIASTNLMDGLDQAALRRFDLKLKFDYLKPEQAWRLFEHQCQSLGLGIPAITLKRKLDKLNLLTPGDYATTARQNRLRPAQNPSALLDALEDECRVKGGGGKAGIGFI